MALDKDLQHFLDCKYNVLLIGEKGTGKTSMTKAIFEKNNIPYIYFSASTMDAFVDFIGIPRPVTDENGDIFLDFVQRKIFAKHEVKAIIIDEYNRAPKKVRNALLEIIQNKSLNGKPMHIDYVWAMTNPWTEDGDYNVEKLDPAEEDRFHIKLSVPNRPDKKWFIDKYGEVGEIGLAWWHGLSAVGKTIVSPRRLEYALTAWGNKTDLSYVIPEKEININQLKTELAKLGLFAQLPEFAKMSNAELTEITQKKPNIVNFLIDQIEESKFRVSALDCFPKEQTLARVLRSIKLASLLVDDLKSAAPTLLSFDKLIENVSNESIAYSVISPYLKQRSKTPDISNEEITEIRSLLKTLKEETSPAAALQILDKIGSKRLSAPFLKPILQMLVQTAKSKDVADIIRVYVEV